ncbi:nitrate reductase [Neoroseomonas oryzicola]|uniref:Molybdopterin-dependent oxidoreductase n=1 Tax=Neoroseomonas oryzicola TaxID=535904 RepID=A0A9X9WKD0_9PROT|nr:molybdopterin-dependent oxidoreductase [Neoroseomonas oryzicola]MBR0660790.1 molybdopterin-dependent oxidoreductase [Neoroseomonas oryzicola]NKE19036.1 molybdopterin-dependent oxidoreductase [Neoroseomonas oryzicola]
MDGSLAARTVRTTCPYCGVGCGIRATPDGRGGAAIEGDTDHPANHGRLCSKGAALGETIGLADRLLHPEVGGKRASWDAALDAVAEGFARALERLGPDGVALYVSGQLLTEDYYAANKFAKGVLGTGNIDSNSRLCMASAVAAHRRAFGEDVVPGVYEDLEQADLLVLVGSNLAWCHPVLFQRVMAAKVARPEMRIVVIDPRRTATCEGADTHLAIAPASDVALFAALLAHLEVAGLGDAGRLEGADAALAAARAIAPDAPVLTGLPAEEIAAFCALWAATPRVVTLWSQGVNQSSAGTDKANAIINAHLYTGRIGRPGMGPFSVTGQPNAMGGRETGALANMLAGHLDWERPGEHAALASFWGLPRLATKSGLKAVDLFRRLGDGGIGALWVMATNPAVSLPEGDAVRGALAAAPFLVVSDTTQRSDTAAFAHIRLPALAWGEKDGTVTNSERMISRQRAFLPAPGEARPDWWAVAQVARRLGHGDAFAWRDPSAIFREHATVTGLARPAPRAFDISGLAGMTEADYAAMRPTRWPVPAGAPSRERFFADGDVPAGRARLVPIRFRAPDTQPDAAFPLRLLTGRLRDQWHTMTRTGGVPRLMAHAPEPMLTLHPDDLPELVAGTLVKAETPTGSAVMRLARDAGQRRGTAFVPMHWTAQFAPAARINAALIAATDPVSGQPELKHSPLRVVHYAAHWHGFLIGPQRLDADIAAWCAAMPVEGGGWRHELAGEEPPAEAFARLRGLLPAEEWVMLEDPAAGIFRAAALAGGTLVGAVAVAPEPRLPPRAWLAALMTSGVLAPEDRAALLVGRRAGGPPPSPVICACHAVTEAVIAACGANDLDGVGKATGAGTGCGSCRPEIARLLTRETA